MTLSTRVLVVDPLDPDAGALAEAAAVLHRGGLVAFPTETVYGLGAHAGNADAVRRLFAAKGRPATNPVIVHVAEVSGVPGVASAWPEAAELLAQRFWPGPLTLVLPRGPLVTEEVSGGGPTVAVRIPDHPVAQALLRASALPVAAPSANPSTHLSPTTAAHVLESLAGQIDLILDGGPATGGLESTVVDVTGTPPRLLRPGLIAVADLEALVGPLAGPLPRAPNQPARSPGQLARHYAPRTPLELSATPGRRVAELCSLGQRVGWLDWSSPVNPPRTAVVVVLPADPAGTAARLYQALHQLDAAGLDRIVVARPPAGPEWLAVRDRLERAACEPAPG
jgi:L-threonylcarbamoyladenylate synthase